MTAGKNEKDFKDFFEDRYKKRNLDGKQRYRDPSTKTEISVDNSIMEEDCSILIEIDSANEAKLIVGQYVLLNQLYNEKEKDTVFLIVHYYKEKERSYNPERTIKNLLYINSTLLEKKGLKFCVFNEKGFKDFCNQHETYSAFKENLFELAEEQMDSIKMGD